MVRMPDEEQNKNPMNRFTEIFKKKKQPAQEKNGGCGEEGAGALQEQEKVEKIIRRKVIKY